MTIVYSHYGQPNDPLIPVDLISIDFNPLRISPDDYSIELIDKTYSIISYKSDNNISYPSPSPENQNSEISSNVPAYQLTQFDKEVISGWRDISRPEPDQILESGLKLKEEEETITSSQRLNNIRNKAETVINKINKLQSIIDSRCSKFEINISQKKGSPLYQAMIRVFDERTTNVTYKHYKKALELRKILAKEDSEKLKKE